MINYIRLYHIEKIFIYTIPNGIFDPIDSFLALQNLLPNTTYKWKVKSLCVTSSGAFSNQVSFRTLSGRFAESLTGNSNGIADFIMYPNPAGNNVTLQFNSNYSASCELNIYDFLGRIVFNQQDGFDDGLNNIRINTADLQDGVYLVEVREGNQTIQKKLTISR